MEKNHFQLSDAEFADHFEKTSLDPSLFTHEAHLRLAYIHIRDYGVEKAVENICRQIKRFDQKHGSGTKFNVTITHAAIFAVQHFMQRNNTASFPELIQQFPELKNNFKNLILSHYSWDIFRDEKAREQYLEPDVVPFQH